MAITDTPTTQGNALPAAPAATGTPVPAPKGLAGVIGTGDHKTLGRLYIGFSLVFGVVALGLWAWFALEASKDLAGQTDRAFQNFTLSQLSLVFLFLIPLFIGLATAIVPLQVGASTIAFPRAAAAAFWTWLLSSVLLLVSYLPSVGGGIAGTKPEGTELTYLALAGLVISLLLASVCVATTVVALRTAGLTLDRVPLFAWSMLVATGVWFLTLPIFLANVALIWVDSRWGAPAYFAVSANQWGQLNWVVTQPQIFAFAIPALGIIGDSVATLSGARQPQRGSVLFGIGVFGAFAFGAYVQPVYNKNVFSQWLFVGQSFLIIVPVLLVLAGLVTAMRKGKPKLASPVLLGLVALLLLLLGAVVGSVVGIPQLELQTTSKALADASQPILQASAGAAVYTWGVAMIVVVAAATAAVAGLFLWSSKLTGRALPDGLGKLFAPLLGLAALLVGVPLLVLGFAVRADGLVDSAKTMYLGTLAGAALALVVALVALLLFGSARGSVLGGADTADDDPWGTGQTLEWATDSPPAPGNFGELAVVTSPQPLLDLADSRGDG